MCSLMDINYCFTYIIFIFIFAKKINLTESARCIFTDLKEFITHALPYPLCRLGYVAPPHCACLMVRRSVGAA